MIRIKEPAVTKRGNRKKNWLPYTFTSTVTPALYGEKSPAKKIARAVTKSRKIKPRNTPEKGGDRRTGKVKAPSPAPGSSAGRPKVHATAADRQRAYRERQKVKA